MDGFIFSSCQILPISARTSARVRGDPLDGNSRRVPRRLLLCRKGFTDQSLGCRSCPSVAVLACCLGDWGHGLHRFERIVFDDPDLNATVDIPHRFDDLGGPHFDTGGNDFDDQRACT